VHRHTEAGEVYFLANTSNEPIYRHGNIPRDGVAAGMVGPDDRRVTAAKVAQAYSDSTAVTVSLPPYGAQLLVFTKPQTGASAAASATAAAFAPIDLSAIGL